MKPPNGTASSAAAIASSGLGHLVISVARKLCTVSPRTRRFDLAVVIYIVELIAGQVSSYVDLWWSTGLNAGGIDFSSAFALAIALCVANSFSEAITDTVPGTVRQSARNRAI